MTYKQTFWRTFVVASAMLLTMPATMWAESAFGGGSGTQTDPYQIYNPGHFVQLADEVNAGNTYEGVYFKLTSSIDFKMYGQIPPIGGRYYTVDGAMGIRRFCGYFLGNNRTLYNLTIIENPDQCGLFGCLGYGGYVSDLTIAGNSTITGIGDTGAVVGTAERNTYIYNCTVGENVMVKVHSDASGSSYLPGTFGGIVGSTYGTISGCVSKATISDSGITKATKLGGIAGVVGESARMSDCYFLGTIDATNTIGDIAGINYGSINGCYYHTANRHGGVNGADTDGAKWMGTVTMADGVSGTLPAATFTDVNKSYFGADKYMLLTLNYSAPDGYIRKGDGISYTANDIAIGETERAGQPYYEFTMPGEDVTINANADLKRDIAYSSWVYINIPAMTYTGEPLTPVVQVTDIKDGAPRALNEGEHFSVTLPDEIIHAGEYTAIIDGIGDWAGTASTTFQVEPAESMGRIITPPAAIEGLRYNGMPQVLITAGVAENGTLMYRLDGSEYSAELPRATDVGTYIVYYKLHTDDDHSDTSEQSLVAQIGEATDDTWEGEGTAESPYLIRTADDMNRIALNRDRIDYNGVHFSLENDIDYEGKTQLPIGTLQRRFNGNFNGNGHSFTNMVINKPDDNNVAIFGVVGYDGIISNLHLGEGCSVVGAEAVGSFVSLLTGTIRGCTTMPDVTVSGSREVGGIVGRCVGTIDRCVNQASVTAGGSLAGGIAGSAYSAPDSEGIMSNNLNLGSVEANTSAGGIVGYYMGATFINNYYAGNCVVGGIGGSDRAGQAMLGYSIKGVDGVLVELVEETSVGVAYNAAVYAGNEQQVVLRLSRKPDGGQSAPSILADDTYKFIASSGNLVNNGDGTWTLTMTTDNVTISAEKESGTDIILPDTSIHKHGQRYNLLGQPVGTDYKGVVVENRRKIIVK